MTSKDYAYCRTCRYCARNSGGVSAATGATCNYILFTGHSRNAVCAAGVGCTCHSKFEGGGKKRHKRSLPVGGDAASLGVRTRDYCKIDKAEARRMYDEGAKDTEIAQRFSCTSAAVRLWRKAYGLPTKHPPGTYDRKEAKTT